MPNKHSKNQETKEEQRRRSNPSRCEEVSKCIPGERKHLINDNGGVVDSRGEYRTARNRKRKYIEGEGEGGGGGGESRVPTDRKLGEQCNNET